MGGNAMIECVGISKTYDSVRVVDACDLILVKGQSLAIVGESGCGKSTVAKMIAGLIKPDMGVIRRQGSVQMVFQDPYMSFDPLWTVGYSLRLAFHGQGLSRQQQQQIMQESLAQVGLDIAVLGRYPHEFSGGQRQRLALARCLLAKADVLILDEVTSNVDVLIAHQLIALLKQMRQQRSLAIIFITHHLTQALSLADTIMVMKKGQFVETIASSLFLTQATHPYTQMLAKTVKSC
jgi:ABC-type dipeptide/oligopeptide/nickel transport system ATPase subunit